MKKRKTAAISLLALSLFIIIAFFGCNGDDLLPEKEFESFSNIIESENLDELTLTIYYIDSEILTRYPLSVDNLINFNNVTEIVVKGDELKEHIDLFKKLDKTNLKRVKDNSSINARIYYVFESEKDGKVFDVAMWGNNNSVFVNGTEVKWNLIFSEIIKPFLTEDAKNNLEAYIKIAE